MEKINLDDIFLNPIENLYKKIVNESSKSFDQYVEKEMIDNSYKKEIIDDIENYISSNENAIKDNFKKLNVKNSWIKIVFTSISFLVLIGFFFIYPFLNAIRKVKEYSKIKKELSNVNSNLKKKIFNLNLISLGTINIFDFLKNYLEGKGIRNFDILKDDISPFIEVFFKNNISDKQLVDGKNIIGIIGIQCKIRNNSFYDVLIRQLNFRPVITEVSVSFPYIDMNIKNTSSNFSSIGNTKFEILSATHSENTPFIDEKNIGIFKTNFDKDFYFYCDSKKNNDIIFLENKEFSKIYKIHKTNNRISLNSFFTIKAQEEYLLWSQINGGYFYFFKFKDNIFIDYNIMNNQFHLLNNNFLSFIPVPQQAIIKFVPLNEKKYIDQNFEVIKGNLKNQILKYLEKFSQSILIPLLSPVINREFYKQNKNYLLQTNLNFESIDNQEHLIKNNESFLNKFINEYFLTFLFKKTKKDVWYENVKSERINNSDCINYIFNLCSFWSEQKVDIISVVGRHVGLQTIPVNYEKFYEIKEEKNIIFLPRKNTFNNTKISISIKKQNFNTYDFAKNKLSFLYENNIWTNNPSLLISNIEEFNRFKNLINEYKSASKEFVVSNFDKNKFFTNNNIINLSSLLIDEDGSYFIYNSNISPKNYPKITKLLENLNNLNF